LDVGMPTKIHRFLLMILFIHTITFRDLVSTMIQVGIVQIDYKSLHLRKVEEDITGRADPLSPPEATHQKKTPSSANKAQQ
jgi:hypothetical protein